MAKRSKKERINRRREERNRKIIKRLYQKIMQCSRAYTYDFNAKEDIENRAATFFGVKDAHYDEETHILSGTIEVNVPPIISMDIYPSGDNACHDNTCVSLVEDLP